MKKLFAKFVQDESGASLIEYVLIAAVISVASLLLMQGVNTSVEGVWTRISTALAG